MNNIVELDKHVSFSFRDIRFSFHIKDGFLTIKYGKKIFNTNGEDWVFPFPIIKDRTFILNGIKYVIPLCIVDKPLLYKKFNFIWTKRLLGEERFFSIDGELIKPEELGKYSLGDDVYLKLNSNMLSWDLNSLPYRKLTYETQIMYLVRYAFWDAVKSAIYRNDLSYTYKSYFDKRLFASLTNQKYFLPVIYNTSIEEKILKDTIINEAYPEYCPDWYEPGINGKVPGKTGLLAVKGISKVVLANPFALYSNPKRIAIYRKNVKQSLDAEYPTVVNDIGIYKEYAPRGQAAFVAFVEPKEVPAVYEDSITITKEFAEQMGSTVYISEYVSENCNLLIKKGDIILPGQQIATSLNKDDEVPYFIRTKKISIQGIVEDIIYKQNSVKIIIKCKYSLKVGDKLAFLHGIKGIVSFIVEKSVDDIDVWISTKRLKEVSLMIEGLINIHMVKNNVEKLKGISSLVKGNIQETMDFLNIKKESIFGKISIPEEIQRDNKKVDAWYLPLILFRLAQNATDKVLSNKNVMYDDGGIYIRPISHEDRHQKLGRDIMQIARMKGLDLLKEKSNPTMEKYLSEYTNLLFPNYIIDKK